MLLVVLLLGIVAIALVLVALIVSASRRLAAIVAGFSSQIADKLDFARAELEQKFGAATADMAQRLARTHGDLRQELADRLEKRFSDFQAMTTQRLDATADRLATSLAQGRKELSESLAQNGTVIREELGSLTRQTAENIDRIRAQVDEKLAVISSQVADKLDQNIKEGFKQFEKVQEHLRAAEEQLKNVNTIGHSINDLNNLLKLPHLRGRFGEASLQRLLADFLPAQMYELQASAGFNGNGRADAIIRFPERCLPIDAKFPREQVLPLFETSDPAQLTAAREQFARVIKEQARRIASYIHPEDGTTDMALMYLPSETLYMEAILNGELSEWLNKQKIFPVSPNTLIVTLQSIQMVFKMYEFAKSYEQATLELQKAQAGFAHFENKFELIGKSLGKAQESYEVARGHLSRYRNRVTNLTGEVPPELESNGDGAGK
jgi:DNA recombination protein RmuC